MNPQSVPCRSGTIAAKRLGILWALFALTACQTPPPPPPPAPPPVVEAPAPPPVVTRAASIDGAEPSSYQTSVEKIFAEGLELYEKGDYAAAIKKFQTPELNSAWPELRVRALKYLAFSQCVSNQLTACQQTFYEALQVFPDFELKAAEQGHPIWGPVYQKAKSGPPVADAPANKRGTRRAAPKNR